MDIYIECKVSKLRTRRSVEYGLRGFGGVQSIHSLCILRFFFSLLTNDFLKARLEFMLLV